MTLSHYLLSFAEEDSFKVMCKLFTKTSKIFHIEDPYNQNEEKEVEEYEHFWPLIIEILENSSKIEIHYSLVRFVATLIQAFEKFNNGNNGLELTAKGDEESTPYGTLL